MRVHTVVLLVTTHKKAARMQVHSNATTNKKQRERMIGSTKTCRTLAQEMAISLGTVHRWKHRNSPEEKSCRPQNITYAFDTSEQALILSLRQQEIEHRTTLPYTPKTNGMVERMNGLTKENTTKRNRYVTVRAMLDDLHGWFVRYNFCRRNRRIGGKTPCEAVLAWHKKDPTLFLREPTALLVYRSQSNDT